MIRVFHHCQFQLSFVVTVLHKHWRKQFAVLWIFGLFTRSPSSMAMVHLQIYGRWDRLHPQHLGSQNYSSWPCKDYVVLVKSITPPVIVMVYRYLELLQEGVGGRWQITQSSHTIWGHFDTSEVITFRVGGASFSDNSPVGVAYFTGYNKQGHTDTQQVHGHT